MSEPAVTPAADPAADFAAFEARENALAVGETPAAEPAKPEPAAPVADAEPEPDKSVTPPSPTSKRTERRAQRDQEQINETIRRAVTEATEATERRLRAELAAPKTDAKSEPAAKADEFQVTRPRPTEAEFESYPDFIEALSDWKSDQRDAKREFDAAKTRAAEAETAQRTHFHERATTWIERRDAFAAVTPEFEEKAVPFLDTITANTPIGDVLLESEVGPQMALYLATHPDEAKRIAALAPISALRALGKLEAKFDTDTTTSASASTAGPAARTVTTAPAPPRTLASRSATPADPAAAALAAGDYPAWEVEENRKAVLAAR